MGDGRGQLGGIIVRVHCESTVEPRLTLCQGNVKIISFKTGYHYSRIPGKAIYRDTIKEQGG